MYHSSPVKKSPTNASFTVAKYANRARFGAQIHREEELPVIRPTDLRYGADENPLIPSSLLLEHFL
jgi:hypothetical protein